MDKAPQLARPASNRQRRGWFAKVAGIAGLVGLIGISNYTVGVLDLPLSLDGLRLSKHRCPSSQLQGSSPYGRFPSPGDPFRFLPCTNLTVPPALDDPDPEKAWDSLFEPNPEHWSWGNKSTHESADNVDEDPYSGRGIYLCGYLDVPIDYKNKSDHRVFRLAVTKFRVSGVTPLSSRPSSDTGVTAGDKSDRTIVVEPGGPGGSGTSYVWRAGEDITARLSNGTYDVLGWDPRGVNVSLPSVACYPYDADRDRWSAIAGQYRETSALRTAQLELADAMNEAVFRACRERHGDLGRFISTASVARDMEELRKALGEDELTGYLVSYGTGIGQTYANMFPGSVGRLVLDGTEYVRDHRLLGGFGWTALDNATDAWRDGFLGECLNAGPQHCALAKSDDRHPVRLPDLEVRMTSLIKTLIHRPMPGYTESSGPSLVTYSALVGAIYSSLYNARSWPALAQMLYELESGNSTLAATFLDSKFWAYNPAQPPPLSTKPASDELGDLVICADSYDAPQPDDGLVWWDSLWANMTAQAWISGNSRFFNVLPCRHFNTYWDAPAEVYRGDLNHTLKNPVLLIAETYDPATPLRNGRRLAKEMGRNARLIAHHGYGHSSRDTSDCTDSIARRFILHGDLPDKPETACHANEKPYLYGATTGEIAAFGTEGWDPVEAWREHLRELAIWNPRLLPRL